MSFGDVIVRSAHSPECRLVYPHELLEPGEELPKGVSPDIGLWLCAEGCPRLAEVRAWAVEKLGL